jgi:hypothetical protein
MARRKHHAKKRHHTKRRRHSAMHGIGGSVASVAYVAGGAILAQVLVNKFVAPMTTSQTATTQGLISGAVPIALGILTPKFLKGDIGAKLGAGMVAAGGLNIIKATAPSLISGIGANYYGNKPVRNIAGYQGASAGTYIAGIKNSAIMEAC